MGSAASTANLTEEEKKTITHIMKEKYEQMKVENPNIGDPSMDVELFNKMSGLYKEEADKIVQRRPSAAVAEVSKPQKRGTFTVNPPSAVSGQKKNHRNGTFVVDPKEAEFKNAQQGGNDIAAALAEANKIIAADEDQAMLANAAQIEAQMKSANGGQSDTSEFRARRLTMATRNTNEAPAQPQRASVISSNNRVTLFKADEFGVRHDESTPFGDNLLGTYSCHGIEPDPNAYIGSLAKNNQDRGGVVYPFNAASGRQEALFLVLDGHGESGDQVSEFIMRNIVEMMSKHPQLMNQPVKALKESFITANEALTSTKINYITSGTTAVAVYMVENKLYVACSGDSRCVVAIDDKAPNHTGKVNDQRKSPTAANNSNHSYVKNTYKNRSPNPYRAMDLSRDHKPDDPDEEARIRACGGFVAPPREPGLSARVYLDRQCTLIGLAMSRSLGDYAVKEVGVTAEPEVNIHELSQQDKFMIMASDGVWEFITSQEAVDIVQNNLAKGSSFACKELIQTAMARWQDMEGDYRDDITAIVVQFPLQHQHFP